METNTEDNRETNTIDTNVIDGGEKKRVMIYIDGASRSNPGPSSVAVIVVHPDQSKSLEFSEGVGKMTNSEAEFIALKKAIEICRLHKFDRPLIHTDSRLVANAVIGRWRVRSQPLKKIIGETSDIIQKTREELDGYFKPEIRWLPREDPMMMKVDGLCNQELNGKIF